ncbi:hypothetical protein KCP76_15900 [Salmonella enterica subsp. enterica serovar Weltevreden]|nr:hypothetical protein KCP76_15900 [Salmonella enterica subsp. enterica serovar Weltevreden]
MKPLRIRQQKEICTLLFRLLHGLPALTRAPVVRRAREFIQRVFRRQIAAFRRVTICSSSLSAVFKSWRAPHFLRHDDCLTLPVMAVPVYDGRTH